MNVDKDLVMLGWGFSSSSVSADSAECLTVFGKVRISNFKKTNHLNHQRLS
jgi:hypothetical protein